MKVPRSAIGKMGMCPACGKKIPIGRSSENGKAKAAPFNDPWNGETSRKWQKGAAPDEAAKREFGRAADLYCEGRFGEALAIFDALARRFPDSPEIQSARSQCVAGRNRKPIELPEPGPDQVLGSEFNDETRRLVKQVLMDKMLHAASESVQVQAAEVIGRMLGMFPDQIHQEEEPEEGRNRHREGTPHSRDVEHRSVNLDWTSGPAVHSSRSPMDEEAG
ncbi:MAG: hypothetical protein HYV27_23770 [Candidatus Hydrogenedentes bacterium]|nr:hypothetical protein [Candidatus Hydrogenedentota bacterium]